MEQIAMGQRASRRRVLGRREVFFLGERRAEF